MDDSFLKQLSDVIETRKSMPAEKSYVASLHHKGLNKILEKVSEESAETILAEKDAEHSGENDKVV